MAYRGKLKITNVSEGEVRLLRLSFDDDEWIGYTIKSHQFLIIDAPKVILSDVTYWENKGIFVVEKYLPKPPEIIEISRFELMEI